MGQYVVKDSLGIDRIIWRQELGSSCGPACCFMVVCYVRQQSFGGGEAFMRELAAKYGASVFDMTVGAGTSGWQLSKILQDNKLTVDNRRLAVGEFRSLVLVASEEKPVILNVEWENGGGHWVVCVGVNIDAAVILDPYYGLSEVPITELPAYNPETKDACVNSKNKFSGWFVRVV